MSIYLWKKGRRLDPNGLDPSYEPMYGCGNAFLTAAGKAAIQRGTEPTDIIWHGTSACCPWLLQEDGRAVVNRADGQVCVLPSYFGNRAISLAQLEVLTAAGSHHTPAATPMETGPA